MNERFERVKEFLWMASEWLRQRTAPLRDLLAELRERFSDFLYHLGIGRHSYSRSLSWRLLGQYFLSLLASAAGIAFFALCCILFFGAFNWWRNSTLLRNLLYACRDYFLLLYILAVGIAWILCTIHLLRRPLGYLDELVAAAERLTQDSGRMIFLPAPLREAQDHLNLLRERSLRAAAVAKEAEQRKNDLIVYLAHDLKTPLTSVIGYLTLLRDEEEISPRLREKDTGIALDKALRLEDLVNEFFDITRFNLTTLTLEPERTNLSRMLEQMVSEFSPVLQEKELSWETAISQDVEISCDRDKLQRVLDNLIRNAVSYSAPGTAILVAMEPEGNEVVLRLQNHGRTIPPEKLCHIFEQFYRVDSSRASATGGAGLGLAIAKEIVELHGGSITAESEQESILFTVRLPKGL